MTNPAEIRSSDLQTSGVIKKGGHVFHRTYGYGTIIKIVADQAGARYVIEFERGSQQRLKRNYSWHVLEHPATPEVQAKGLGVNTAIQPEHEPILGTKIPQPEKEEAMLKKEPPKEASSGEAAQTSICGVCGRECDEDMGVCDSCCEEGISLADAMMYAKDTKEAMVAWATWRSGRRQPKDDFSPVLSNCRPCHKLMWVPIDSLHLNPQPQDTKFCSRECAGKAKA